jgi:hypothetical protein
MPFPQLVCELSPWSPDRLNTLLSSVLNRLQQPRRPDCISIASDLPPRRLSKLQIFKKEENFMAHVISSLFLVGAFVFAIALVHAAKVLLRNRREKAAPFRNYFTAEYDRELLRYSALSEDEEWRADIYPRTAPSFTRNSTERG